MAKKIITLLIILISTFVLLNAFWSLRTVKEAEKYSKLNFSAMQNEDTALAITNSSQKIIKNYKKINQNIKKIILKNWAPDLSIILEKFLTEDQHFLILLQNTDELRTTGGFIGSYLYVDFRAGQLNFSPIQDIYELAGQQTVFPDSPKGQAEFLSEGKGLSLSDANWWPDFPQTAMQILEIWTNIEKNSDFVNEEKITGVIALNLSLFEQLLAIVGPIELPDYQSTVTADNFAALARANRVDFFAGSKEKANFLNHLRSALMIRLQSLSKKQQLALLATVYQGGLAKNWQIWSLDPDLQKIWQKQGLAGQMQRKNPAAFYFYSVESNVGINKANRLIERDFQFFQGEQSIEEIRLNFTNRNQVPSIINTNPDLKMADHLSYINYQRCYFSPSVTVKSVQQLNPQGEWEDLDWQTSQVFNSMDQEFLELAFLLLVPEQTSQSYRIRVNNREATELMELQKQAGITQIPISLEFEDTEKQTWTLSSDQLE